MDANTRHCKKEDVCIENIGIRLDVTVHYIV